MEGDAMSSERLVESHPDEELLSRMLDGEVSPDEFVDILRHLSRCDRCLRDARELWYAFSIISDLAPNLTGEVEELSGDLTFLEEVVLSKLSDLISIHWASCVPGARRFKAEAARFKVDIEVRTRRAARAKLSELESDIFSYIARGLRPDLDTRPRRRRRCLRPSFRVERFHRFMLAFEKPIRTIRSAGKVKALAWSGVRPLVRTLARFAYGGRR